jgi:predicted DNA-binding transcriptional regulator AlpA
MTKLSAAGAAGHDAAAATPGGYSRMNRPVQPSAEARAPREIVIPRLLTVQDMAQALGVSMSAMYRALPVLADAGFPQPLPGLGKRWDPEAVAAWLASRRTAPPAPPPAPPAAAPEDDIATWQRLLDGRAADIAGA